jgi:multicomponent Na+:H+ antiporter subunit G
MLEVILQALAAFLLLTGGAFTLISALGVYRLPDPLIRMHATSKAGTLGCGLILLAVAVFYREGDVVARVAVAILFLLVTVPVSAHMIGRATYAMGCRLWEGTVVDELRDGSRAGSRPKGHRPLPARDPS